MGFTIYLSLYRLNCLNVFSSLFIRRAGVLEFSLQGLSGVHHISHSLSSRSRDGSLQALHTSDECVRGLAMMGGEGKEGCPVCHQLLVKGGVFSGVGTGDFKSSFSLAEAHAVYN